MSIRTADAEEELSTGARTRVPVWLAVFLVFVAAGLLQSMSVDWSRALSEYDEVPHIDYALRLADGDITTWDDVYTQRTLGLAVCLEEQSADAECVRQEVRIPQERWPNGYSYQAQQAPTAYLPYAIALRSFVAEDDNHFAQIRELRWVNSIYWVLLAGAWTILLGQVTRRMLPSLAVTAAVAVNPLVFDSFTYVTNDAAAIVVATGVAAWLLHALRSHGTTFPVRWLPIAIAGGLLLGLTKATALIVLVPLGLAVWASHKVANRGPAPRGWWPAYFVMVIVGGASGLAYQQFIAARSQLTFQEVFSVILPRGPLDLPDSAFVRVPDISEMVLGSGARTDQVLLESGMRTASSLLLIFALVAAFAFLVGIALRRQSFDKNPLIDHSVLGIAVVAGALVLLIALPALWEIQGGFLTYVNIGRYLGTLIPLAGLVALITYQRYRPWAVLTIVLAFAVALFSGPWSQVQDNFAFVERSLGL